MGEVSMGKEAIRATLTQFHKLENAKCDTPRGHIKTMIRRMEYLKRELEINPTHTYNRQELKALKWALSLVKDADMGPIPGEPGAYMVHIRDLCGQNYKVVTVGGSGPKAAVWQTGSVFLRQCRSLGDRQAYDIEWCNPDSVYPSLIVYRGYTRIVEIIAEEQVRKG